MIKDKNKSYKLSLGIAIFALFACILLSSNTFVYADDIGEANDLDSKVVLTDEDKSETPVEKKLEADAGVAEKQPDEDKIDKTSVQSFTIKWLPRKEQASDRYTVTDDGKYIETICHKTGNAKGNDKPEYYEVFQKGQIYLKLDAHTTFDQGDLQIRIPAHIYKNRDGKFCDKCCLSVPDAPSDKNKFFYTYDKNTDEIVIKNAHKTVFNGEGQALLDFAYAVKKPVYVKTGTKGHVSAHLIIHDSEGVETKIDTPSIEGQVNTELGRYRNSKSIVDVYPEWDESWGDTLKPEDAEDYIFFKWVLSTEVLTASQPYTIKVNDICKTKDMKVIGYSDAIVGPLSDTKMPKPDIIYKEAKPVTITDPTEEYFDSDANPCTKTNVITAIPKKNLTKPRTIENIVAGQLKGIDESKWRPIKEYKQVFKFKPLQREAKHSSYQGGKSCPDKCIGILSLEKKKDVTIDSFGVGMTIDAADITLKDGADPLVAENYGKESYKVAVIDDLYFLGDLSQDDLYEMQPEDYEVSYITILPPKAYRVLDDYKLGKTVYKELPGEEYPEFDVLVKDVEGKWHKAARYVHDLDYSGDDMFTIVDIDKDWLHLIHAQYNRCEISPQQQITGVKLEGTSNAAKLKVPTIESKVVVHPTQRILEEVKNARRNTPAGEHPEIYVSDVATLEVRDKNNKIQFIDTKPQSDKLTKPLQKFLRKSDKALYNADGLLPHFVATSEFSDVLNVEPFSNINKKCIKKDNNGSNKCFDLSYEVKVEEGWRLLGSSSEEVEEAGIIKPLKDGAFWDLLPVGVTVDESSVSLYPDFHHDKCKTEVIKNYKNSGRDLLIVRINGEADSISYISGSKPVEAYEWELRYKATYPWDRVAEWGREPYNSVAYQTGNDEIAEGFADDGGNLKDKDLMSGLDKNNNGKKTFIYASSVDKVQGLMNTEMKVSKSVKRCCDDEWGIKAEVGVSEKYHYMIRTNNFSNTRQENIVFYDKIEVGGKGKNRWQGTFESVDTKQLEFKGAKPVVYYSTKKDIDTSLPEHKDLTNKDIWSLECPKNKRDVVAVAVDVRKRADGSPFVLGNSEACYFIMNMRAPDDVFEVKYLNEINSLCINSAIEECDFITEIGDKDIHNEDVFRTSTTKTSLKPTEVEFGLDITKTMGKLQKPGEGVVFAVYKDSDPKGCVFDRAQDEYYEGSRVVCDKDGKCVIDGLLPGDWWLVEEKTNVGYDKVRPIHIHINKFKTGDNKDELIEVVEYKEDGNTCEIANKTYLPIKRTFKVNAYGELLIRDKDAIKLPFVGGGGTNLVLGVGSMLLGASVVSYFVRKRRA